MKTERFIIFCILFSFSVFAAIASAAWPVIMATELRNFNELRARMVAGEGPARVQGTRHETRARKHGARKPGKAKRAL